ncbi:MAG: hypothetical protein OEY89_13500, partial [Gammaproteobacteria bacterium]|nr:hypothetical protein [Gammaproteobacteria bacterium]
MTIHDDKKKKRVINKMKIGELSAVDKPAQAGAKSVIMKRLNKNPVLLTLADDSGHSHLLEFNREYDSNQTSYAGALSDDGHSHPFIIKDGKAVIGENHGHSHEVDTDDLNQTLMTLAMVEAIKEDLERSENSTYKSLEGTETLIKSLAAQERSINKPASDGGVIKSEVVKMAVDEKKLEDIQKSLDTVTTELAFAKSYGELNDAEKAHYSTLSKSKAEKFIALDKAARTAELDELKKADPIVFTSESGEVFHKSDDARLVKMAKDRDEDRKELRKQKEANETLEFTKRAETDLEFMPGTVETRVALLKSVDTIEDEAVKAEVLKSLKAKNASLGKNFEVVGESGEADPSGNDSAQKLESLAKSYAAK